VKKWLLRRRPIPTVLHPDQLILDQLGTLVRRAYKPELRRSAHSSVTELETDIRKWINTWNADPKPFLWTNITDKTLGILAAYCRRINDPGY
jgi:hypothetical protein